MILQKLIFDAETKKDIPIDLHEIIKSRALLQANSGGGKSHIIRKFCEKAHGKVQQIIIDPEGEFHTLREKYEYLLIAKGNHADIQIDTQHAPLLAKKLMETGASAILDLYELNPFERIRFVKLFLDSLINLPKKLRQHCIIIIDEIHTFAPESKSGRSESLASVAALASRGRKRGYALVGATQRISKLNKDVAAELNTKLIGRCSLDVDRKRAGEELGIKETILFRKLKHEFYAFGPAISDDNILVKAYPTETSSDEIGSIQNYTPVNKSKINLLMKNFAELPQEAELDLKTIQGLQIKVKELTTKLTQTQKEQPKQDPLAIDRAYQRGILVGEKESKEIINTQLKYIESIKRNASKIKQKISELQSNTDHDFNLILQTAPDIAEPKKTSNPKFIPIETFAIKEAQASVNLDHGNLQTITIPPKQIEGLTGPETKILTAIVQRPNHLGTRNQISLMSGYSIKSSGFTNPLGHLRKLGYIEYSSDGLTATDEGITALGDYIPLPTDSKTICDYWLNKVTGPERRILKPIIEAFPEIITREDCAEIAGYSITSSGFTNPLGHLRKLGLIEYVSRDLKATKELFPDD